MRLEDGNGAHLTYCSNIHPGETWIEVREQLGRYLSAIKARVAPDRDFGIGLRLSAVAAETLSKPEALSEFKAFLEAGGFYVFTLNGFPYGEFHGAPVKEKVYRPDWRDEARLAYSNRLADLLAALLPEGESEGTISTVPGGFKRDIRSASDVSKVAENLVRHAAHLAGLERRTGRTVSLELEPEPCCLLETIDESVAFFREHLHSPGAVSQMADITGLPRADAEAALRRHLGLCLDLCHAAVEFEDPREALASLRDAGIRIGKMQISAGLRVPTVDPDAVSLLRPFDDDVYLHQVVERTGAGLTRYTDLPDAFAADAGRNEPREWRIHFHVPIFLGDLGRLATTQDFIRTVLALHRESPVTRHLEVETYTWDVLPPEHRNVDIVTAVARELDWVRGQLGA